MSERIAGWRGGDPADRADESRRPAPGKRARTEGLPATARRLDRPAAQADEPMPGGGEGFDERDGHGRELEDPFGVHLLGDQERDDLGTRAGPGAGAASLGGGTTKPAPTPAAAAGPAEPALANPPEGLEYPDGITPATVPRRPYVRRLQQLLGEKLNAALVPDGKFGDETLALLHDFQAKHGRPPSNRVDAETAQLLTGSAPKPTTKQFPAHNPKLEDLMDVIWLQHQISIQHVNNALNQLAIDLAKPTPEKGHLLKDVLQLAARTAVTMLPMAGSMLVETVFKIHPPSGEDEKKVVEAALEAPWEVLKEDPEKAIEKGFEHWTEPRAPEVAAPDYVEAQRRKITKDALYVQSTFLLHSKEQLRRQDNLDPAAADEDPRIPRANKALLGAQMLRKRAEADQYAKSLSEWSAALARTDLGDRDKTAPGRGVDMTEQSKVDAARGVLELEGIGVEASPHHVVLATGGFTLRGVPPDAAKHLKGQRLRDLTLPIRAKIYLADGASDASDHVILMIRRSGTSVWNGVTKEKHGERGRRYLAVKAYGAAAAPTDANADDGVRTIFNKEIADTVIGDLKKED